MRIRAIQLVVQNGKQTRAVILPDNSAIVLYRTQDDEVYCSDANSTAYKFPMIDANVIESEHLSESQICSTDWGLVDVIYWMPMSIVKEAQLLSLHRR